MTALMIAAVIGMGQAATPTSSDYAQMARRMWSAFECSNYAASAGEQEDQRRLFIYGLEQGRAYIDALRANLVQTEDIRRQVPVAVNMRIARQSNDFILGMIYADAEEEAAKEVWDRREPRWVDRPVPDEELRRIRASNAYTRGHCDAIGPSR